MLAKRVVKLSTFVYLSFYPSLKEKKIKKNLLLLPLSESQMSNTESNKKRSKELMPKMRQRRLRAITSKRAIKKMPEQRRNLIFGEYITV